ncbi:MAG: histidinol-phosphate aminotransferase [Herpetosiphonaceae bacterium]|nr:MAG: histidinol-phosphate aminotransferase [Herpetosiphonaceae bacterium]
MHFKDSILALPVYKPPKLTAIQPPDTVKLSSNENPLGPAPRAIEAIRKHTESIYRYPDAAARALKQALARRFEMPEEMILVSNGSDELVSTLSSGFLRPGDRAIMALGSFIVYYLRARVAEAEAVRVPLRPDFTHDLPAMAAAIDERTRLLYVCNPNNPTGTMSSAKEMADLLERVPDHVLVVSDEAYVEFVERADFPDTLAELRRGRRNLLVMRTFSKIYGLAGLRVGYAFAHPDVVSYLERVRPVFNVNYLAQLAAAAALEDDEFVARSRAYAHRCRELFTNRFAAMGLDPIPSVANFVACKVGDDMRVCQALLERGFAVTPLSGWGVPGYIRASFAHDDEVHERFFAILDEVIQQ